MKDKILRGVFALLTVMITLFILIMSSESAEQSKETSEEFQNTVVEIVGDSIPTVSSPESAIIRLDSYDVLVHIRKLAHFIEYGALGIAVSLFALVGGASLQKAVNSYCYCLSVAVADEGLQILSGRGPAVMDILRDVCGFSAMILTAFGIAVLIQLIKKARA